MYIGVVEHLAFHLAAIHAAVAREVDKHGLALLAGGGHTLVVVVIFGESASVEVEVLGVERRHECADALQGAPQSPGTR